MGKGEVEQERGRGAADWVDEAARPVEWSGKE